MSLYDFLFINLGLPQLSPYYISLCRFRTFILNFAQTTSPWLLVCIAFDRIIRARLPHHTRQWCTKKNCFIAIFIIVLCSVIFNSHVLQPSFTTVLPFTRVICGPSLQNVTDYTIFYYLVWPVLQLCIDILVPGLLMIIALIVIYQKVRDVAWIRRNQNLQNQMLVLMLSKTILFLICTLPYAAYRMATIYSLDRNKPEEYKIFLVVTALLTILLNANFSLTFYIHCLTSSLFRQTFFMTIKICKQRQNTIQPIIATAGTMR